MDPSIKNLQKSCEIITKFKKEKNMDFEFYPICMDEEIWPIKDESLDLIVSSLNLHWTNDITAGLLRMHDSLKPDGALMGKQGHKHQS